MSRPILLLTLALASTPAHAGAVIVTVGFSSTCDVVLSPSGSGDLQTEIARVEPINQPMHLKLEPGDYSRYASSTWDLDQFYDWSSLGATCGGASKSGDVHVYPRRGQRLLSVPAAGWYVVGAGVVVHGNGPVAGSGGVVAIRSGHTSTSGPVGGTFILGGEVQDGSARVDGGCVAIGQHGRMTLKAGARVHGCSAGRDGGAISVDEGTLEAVGSIDARVVIEDGLASRHGGGVHAQGSSEGSSTVTLELTDVNDNVAESGNGGGIHLLGTMAEVTNSRLFGNTARTSGGAIAVGEDATAAIASDFERCAPYALLKDESCSEILDNSATSIGGVVALDDGVVSLDTSSVGSNDAGGIGAFGTSKVAVRGTLVWGHRSTAMSPAPYAIQATSGATLSVELTTVADNHFGLKVDPATTPGTHSLSGLVEGMSHGNLVAMDTIVNQSVLGAGANEFDPADARSTYALHVGSMGANLVLATAGLLQLDLAGVSRPATGAWDAGALDID